MIPFEEARERVLSRMVPVSETESVAVTGALGRVLAEAARTSIDVPTHANSAMDGYALRHGDLNADGPTEFKVTTVIAAGSYRSEPLAAGEAARIMTGAPIPPGCDCVVMQEVAERDGERLVIPAGQAVGQSIRAAGEDMVRGTEILPRGRRLSPADLGLLAATGHGTVTVFRRLKVGVLSTGDEVTEPGQSLKPGCLYDSNRVTLMAALQAMNVEVVDLGLARDVREEIAAALQRGSKEADVILTSGGVSVGDFDLVKDVIAELGEIDFWKVRMKPGKPQAHGKLGGAFFFGLPGNPVSSLAVFLVIVRPALETLMGSEPSAPKHLRLPIRGGATKKHDRLDFQRGVVHFDPGGGWVESTGTQSSGALSSMSRANAFIVLPEEPVTVADGELVDVWLIDYT